MLSNDWDSQTEAGGSCESATFVFSLLSSSLPPVPPVAPVLYFFSHLYILKLMPAGHRLPFSFMENHNRNRTNEKTVFPLQSSKCTPGQKSISLKRPITLEMILKDRLKGSSF